MTAWFRDNQIYRNDVNGNAQTIYYMQDGEPPEITGMRCHRERRLFVLYRGQTGGDRSPTARTPSGTSIRWTRFPLIRSFTSRGSSGRARGVRRSGAVFDRQGPALAARGEERICAHPDFPLLKALEERKKQLIEERRWADRNDQVDAATVEWMRALGFEVGQPRESGTSKL